MFCGVDDVKRNKVWEALFSDLKVNENKILASYEDTQIYTQCAARNRVLLDLRHSGLLNKVF